MEKQNNQSSGPSHLPLISKDDIGLQEDKDLDSLDAQYFPFDIDESDFQTQEIRRYKQDTDERKLLSHWVVIVVSFWLFLVLLLLFCDGIKWICITDTVSCVLLGTTTINILGLAYIVLTGLFPESKKKQGYSIR